MAHKRVSADTITAITASSGFNDPAKTPPTPTTDQLIDDVRQNLHRALTKARHDERAAVTETDRKNAAIACERLARNQKRFEEILQQVPEGFQLAPVLYSKVSQEKNNNIHAEYETQVRARFLQFLAERHSADLRRLGVCEHGISRMHLGLDPSSAAGHLYELNVDHIIERSGSGLWADSKAVDPDRPAGSAPKYRQNHFGNLMLMPYHVHEFKNDLNDIQRAARLQPGESAWILMMVPERNALCSGFVAPPQKPGHPLHGLRLRKDDGGYSLIHFASYTADQANARLEEFRRNPVVGSMLKTVNEIARTKGQTPADAAFRPEEDARRLRHIFHQVLDYDAPSKKDAATLVRPVLREAEKRLSAAFNAAAADHRTQHGRAVFKSFMKFYGGSRVRTLRETAKEMPFVEAAQLEQTCRHIDARAKCIQEEMRRTPGAQNPPRAGQHVANDNTARTPAGPPAAKPGASSPKRRRTRDRNGRRGFGGAR